MMKLKTSRLKVLIVVPLIAMGFYSCSPGGDSLPARKKMPEFASNDGFEGAVPFSGNSNATAASTFAFKTGNIDLDVDGHNQNLVVVAMPDASTDSVALSLVNSVKPFALPMLSGWAKQQGRGVLIDLSSHNGEEAYRADYVLQKPDDFSIPVVLMWDNASASRVVLLKEVLDDVPSISLSCTSGNDPLGITHQRAY